MVVSMMILMAFASLSVFVTSAKTSATARPIVLKDAITASRVFSGLKEEYFEQIIIEEDLEDVTVDGQVTNFAEVFSVKEADAKKAVSSKEKLESFLEKQEDKTGQIYEMEEMADGAYCVTSPYQTRRIVICSTNVKKDYGASSWYLYKSGAKTILCFDSEEQTKAAYEQIRADYGEDHAYVDYVISLRQLSQEGEEQESEMLGSKDNSCYSWGSHAMGMDRLKNSGGFSANDTVTVAVLDTGVITSSPVFKGTKISSASYNFADGNRNIKDVIGHGTHVTGIIADLTPDNVQFLVVKITEGDGTSSSLIMGMALDYAIEQKADVINLSFGFLDKDASSFYFLDDSINQAYQKGIPICAAAGNTNKMVKGRDVNHCYPACNAQTVCVSALTEDRELADYSYYGSAVDFAAPGSRIVSAGIKNDLVSMSGTSMAAPHISAAMAYLKLMNHSLSVQGLCMELKKYSVDLGSKGKDKKYGYGCPDIEDLLKTGITYTKWTSGKMLPAPRLVSCINGAKGNVLTWDSVDKAKGYYIYRRKDGGSNRRIAKVSAGTTSYTDTKISEGDFFLYYVVAYGKKDGITYCSANSAMAGLVTLRPVSVVNARALNNKKVQIQRKKQKYWNGKKIQIQYALNRFYKKSAVKTFRASSTNLKFAIKKKGNYYLRIRTKFHWMEQNYYSVWTTIKRLNVR